MISPRPMSNGDIRTRTRAPGPIALSPTTSHPPGMNATIRCPLGRDAFQALVSKAHRISASNAIVSSAFICAGADFTPFFGKVKPFERKNCEMFAITRNEGGEGGGRRGGRGAGHGRGEGGRLGGIVQLWAGGGRRGKGEGGHGVSSCACGASSTRTITSSELFAVLLPSPPGSCRGS